MGETYAAFYLLSLGHRIHASNLRTPYGEIDLLTEYEGLRHFIEVKTRLSSTYGLPEESITQRKSLALQHSMSHVMETQFGPDDQCEFDVISIQLTREWAVHDLTHYPNFEL